MEIEDATCLRGYIPILIGTIPLRDVFVHPDVTTTTTGPENNYQLHQLPLESITARLALSSGIPKYPDLRKLHPTNMTQFHLKMYILKIILLFFTAPPTYEEAIMSRQIVSDDGGGGGPDENESDPETSKPPEYNSVAFGDEGRFVPRYVTYHSETVVAIPQNSDIKN